MARNYDEENRVYDVTPYLAQAYCLSDDGLEDDICVWGDGPTHSQIFMSEEQLSFYDEPIYPALNQKKAQADKVAALTHDAVSESGSDRTIRDTAGLTDEQCLEWKTAESLLSTQTNLTRMLQFILKLERRAGKVTKEGIRQTLDATVANRASTYKRDHKLSICEEVENLRLLSESAWQRLYLVDRHWRRQSRQQRNDQGTQESTIHIESESRVKAWLKEEIRIKDTVSGDPCYYTVADLASGRSIEDWVSYLMDLCDFKDRPADEAKLVELSWRFLDRSLRGPRPASTTRISEFILQFQEMARSGAFEEALRNPRRQAEDDGQAWKTIRRCLGSRIHDHS